MGQSGAQIPDKLYFKIGEVSQITGIKTYVLRYWETEFPIAPRKSRTGQRLYRREDIEKVLEIRRLLYDEGFTVVGARKHLQGAGAQSEETRVEEAPSSAAPAVEEWQELDPEQASAAGANSRTFLLELRSRVVKLRGQIGQLRAQL